MLKRVAQDPDGQTQLSLLFRSLYQAPNENIFRMALAAVRSVAGREMHLDECEEVDRLNLVACLTRCVAAPPADRMNFVPNDDLRAETAQTLRLLSPRAWTTLERVMHFAT